MSGTAGGLTWVSSKSGLGGGGGGGWVAGLRLTEEHLTGMGGGGESGAGVLFESSSPTFGPCPKVLDDTAPEAGKAILDLTDTATVSPVRGGAGGFLLMITGDALGFDILSPTPIGV